MLYFELFNKFVILVVFEIVCLFVCLYIVRFSYLFIFVSIFILLGFFKFFWYYFKRELVIKGNIDYVRWKKKIFLYFMEN